MKKRLYVYIGIIAVMIVLIIFSAIEENRYKVYALRSEPNIFKAKTATAEKLGSSADILPPDQAKDIMIGDFDVTVHYNQMLSSGMYAYSSEDQRFNCWYDRHTGKLRLISAEGMFKDLTEETTEAQFLDLIYRQVGRYYSENWNNYTKSCTTIFKRTTDTASEQVERKGFLVSSGDESVIAYMFTFTKNLGEYQTSDLIQAYFRLEDGFTMIEFSAHNFDETQEIKLDLNHISRSIKTFIKKSVDAKRFTYLRHEISQSRLSYVNGVLCMVCTVNIDVEENGQAQTVHCELAIKV